MTTAKNVPSSPSTVLKNMLKLFKFANVNLDRSDELSLCFNNPGGSV